MTNENPNSGLDRRDFIRMVGMGTIALLSPRMPVMAGPFDVADFAALVPPDKKLHPDWVKSLFARGERTVYRGDELKFIGMPIGGIGAGHVYLGGDGRLWHWDIFNQHIGTGDSHYAHPVAPESPLEQGFTLQVASGGQTQTRSLDYAGFPSVTFVGEYPIATVEYHDVALPVAVTLEAFSPFIPLNADDSSLPATVLHFTVRNTSRAPVDITLAGSLQNGVLRNSPGAAGTRLNRIVHGNGLTFLNCSVERPTAPGQAPRPDVVFEDWNKDSYTGWTVEGTAFGTRPVRRAEVPAYQGDLGGEGDRFAHSHASAPGNSVGEKDAQTGKLTSRPFTIDRNFIQFWMDGGNHPGRTAMNLLVGGKVVASATGIDDNRMTQRSMDVRAYQGQQGVLEIVDAETGPWGNIGVGRITFSDRPLTSAELEQLPDYGTMGLALLGAPAEHALASSAGGANADATAPVADALIGVLGRKVHLAVGQTATVTFAVTWHFPNLSLDGLGKVGRYYATKFDSAQVVAQHITDNFNRLSSQTRLWRDTWYDSTLPYWFLDRTFLNACILATSTCFRFANGRFYGWEGVGCCPGTCTHVWHYAHAAARLFPELERDTRERVDLGIAFHPDSGVMGFRAEFDRSLAVDGQAGTLLRIYREHQMTSDGAFLKRNWPRLKQAYEPLLQLDGNDDGVLGGAQMNTLDTAWHGEIAWLSSLYLAALRAGAAMASEMGDNDFAARCHAVADRGMKRVTDQLFNGEYYMNRADPAHPEAINSGTGCEIDQVFGQSWAYQVHLDRVLPERETRAALQALWKYNFTPDVGPYRAIHKPGRWYAMAGEAGLLMCTFPRTDWDYDKAKGKGPDWAAGYFNECMNGFEYEVAGHMVWAGMLTEGLAVTRAIHDRYHASRRNPWNEIECGDHYARSMASYGVFLAACGYEYHGPNGYLAFAPRLTPANFKAAFTTAEGWGSYSQTLINNSLQSMIELKWGHLRLKTLALALPDGVAGKAVKVSLAGRNVRATHTTEGRRVVVAFAPEAVVQAGQKLVVRVS